MKRGLSFALLALFTAGAFAQAAQPSASGSASASAAAFLCGGVGQEDQVRMKAEAPRHDLLLTFATTAGAYLADIDVEIRSGDRLVLQGRCDGPLMLVDLPADGSYEVRASVNGRDQRKTVRIGGGPASATFTWSPP
jgi:hypothetical protein